LINYFHIGFTGTRNGMTEHQKGVLRGCLKEMASETEYTLVAHHGDCVGADKDFHDLCEELDIEIVIHPPTKSSARAFCYSTRIHKPKSYLARNRDIVNIAELVIATPDGPERTHSGTWSTVRYAISQDKVTTVIGPTSEEIF